MGTTQGEQEGPIQTLKLCQLGTASSWTPAQGPPLTFSLHKCEMPTHFHRICLPGQKFRDIRTTSLEWHRLPLCCQQVNWSDMARFQSFVKPPNQSGALDCSPAATGTVPNPHPPHPTANPETRTYTPHSHRVHHPAKLAKKKKKPSFDAKLCQCANSTPS